MSNGYRSALTSNSPLSASEVMEIQDRLVLLREWLQRGNSSRTSLLALPAAGRRNRPFRRIGYVTAPGRPRTTFYIRKRRSGDNSHPDPGRFMDDDKL